MARRLISAISLIFLLSLAVSEAKEFIVGGKDSKSFWRVPTNHNSNLNYWAEKNRFRSGDVLVWKSVAEKDSVLEVSKKDYRSCNTTNPMKELKGEDGGGKVTLDRSGPFYFISGIEGQCKKGEKMEVVVMSDHHGKRPVGGDEAPAPAPARSGGSKVEDWAAAMPAAGLVFSFLVFLV